MAIGLTLWSGAPNMRVAVGQPDHLRSRAVMALRAALLMWIGGRSSFRSCMVLPLCWIERFLEMVLLVARVSEGRVEQHTQGVVGLDVADRLLAQSADQHQRAGPRLVDGH